MKDKSRRADLGLLRHVSPTRLAEYFALTELRTRVINNLQTRNNAPY